MEDVQMDERERGFQPLDDATTGCTLVFAPTGPMFQPMSALAILAGLHARRFSGVCECYLLPDIQDGLYLMGVGLEFESEAPDEDWWGDFASDVSDACADDGETRLDSDRCSFTTIRDLRAAMVHAGTAGFEAGSAVWISDPAGPDPDSPFTGLCRRISEEGA
jgi:hypothetical protein